MIQLAGAGWDTRKGDADILNDGIKVFVRGGAVDASQYKHC